MNKITYIICTAFSLWLCLVPQMASFAQESGALGEPSVSWLNAVNCSDPSNCISDIPSPVIMREPRYSQGAANTIYFTLPEASSLPFPADRIRNAAVEVRVYSNGECSGFPKSVDIDDRSILSESINRFRGQPLQDGVRYDFSIVLFLQVCKQECSTVGDTTDLEIHCSIDSIQTWSIQDNTPPLIRVDQLPSATNDSFIRIPFSTNDVISTAVDSAFLFYRRSPDTTWIPDTMLDLEDDSPVDSAFIFDFPDTNGIYQFAISAVDTAWAMDNSGRIGNTSPIDTVMAMILFDNIPPKEVTFDTCFQATDSIMVRWYPSEDPAPGIGLEGYVLYVGSDSVATTSDTSYTFPVSNTSRDSVYKFQVQPFDSLGNRQKDGGRAECGYWGRREITVVSEPEVTKGLTNSICWQADAIFDSFLVLIDKNCDTIPEDSMLTTLTCQSFEDLKNATTYCYWIKGTDEHERTEVSNIVQSTQDNDSPMVQSDSLSRCLANDSLYIVFRTWDVICGAVDSARLYFRSDSTAGWQVHRSKDLNELMMASSSEQTLTDSLLFEAPNDGYFEFYVGAKDTAWAPDNSGRLGNEDVPRKEDARQMAICIDTQKPISTIRDLPPEQHSLCFEIPYTAMDLTKDDYSSGLRSVTLVYRFENTGLDTVETHEYPDVRNQVDSLFSFNAVDGNGTYYFFIRAQDACGNMADSPVDSTEVLGTPAITQIYPPKDTAMFAADVDSIVIIFDREVKPENTWFDAITVINRYNLDAVIPCSLSSEIQAVDTLICWPTDMSPSGFYQIILDGTQVLTAEDDCPALSGAQAMSRFYTYMEEGQGGQILTSDVRIRVPKEQPPTDIVIKFEREINNCTPDGFQPVTDSCWSISAHAVQGALIAGINGTLSLAYSGQESSNLSEGTYRIFRTEPGGCLPVGDSRTVEVNPQAGLVSVNTVDVTGILCILGQSGLQDREIAVGNYPNPFGSGNDTETTITYTLRQPVVQVNVRIYDLFGNLVKTFDSKELTRREGMNSCPWDGKNDKGEMVANGGYICVVNADGKKEMRKIAVMR